MKLAIAVPTYNEAKNIQKLLPSIKKNLANYPKLNCTVFVVDDNSPDGTAGVVGAWSKANSTKTFNVKVLSRKKKEGLGKAYIYAFQKILDMDFDFILQMDADLSHDPKYMPAILDATAEADFVVGSRYIHGGGTPDWAFSRKLQSRLGNLYSRMFLGSKIHDYTGGYNLYSSELLAALDLDSLTAGGYGFLIELKYRAIKKCHGSKEIAIIFMDRQHGISKIPRSTIISNLILVPKIRFSDAKTS